MQGLKVTGRKANILLSTIMGRKGPVHTDVVLGLEVGDLDESMFLKLPQVFSQKEKQVKLENIPQQTDVVGSQPSVKQLG